MKALLLLLTLSLACTVKSQEPPRVRYIDSLVKANKYKMLKKLTAKNEEGVHVAYARAVKEEKLWLVIEQVFVDDGFESSKTTRYIYLGKDLLAVVVVPRLKECRKCISTYYFSEGQLVYKKEEGKPQDVSLLLVASKRYLLITPIPL
jgi:hypothetical protein